MSRQNEIKSVSRRDFLRYTSIAGGAFVLGAVLPSMSPAWADSSEVVGSNSLNLFVSIDDDGTVNIVCHRSEMGQGVRTGIPQIVADELCADWSKVNVVQGLADEAYGSQNTDGSRSIRRFYSTMREMGATARAMLEQAAGQKWGVAVSDVFAENGMIVHKPTGKTLSFAELASAAGKLTPPQVQDLTFKTPDQFTFIGKPMTSVDLPDVLTGNTTFGQDIKLDGMLYASIERCPVVGGSVKTFDKAAPLNVANVISVIEMPKQSMPVLFKNLNGVAVLASNTWSALQGRKVLNIEWELGDNQNHDSDVYLAELEERIVTKGKPIRQAGDAYQAFDDASHKVAATYTLPYLVHAPMEPPAATAVFKDGHCEVWACTQTPQSTQQNVAGALGIDKSKVKINVTLLGGGFGRKSKPDFSVEAAILAQQTGKPVKVIWSREDDIQHGYYHAISAQHFQAGLDDNGKVTSWLQRTAFPSISWTFTGTTDEPQTGELSLGFGDVPFDIENISCETHKAPAHVRIGWMRSVSNIQHGFAIGSFVDEVAEKAGVSTAKMWLNLLGEDRIVDPKTQGFKYENYGESYDTFPIETKRLKHVLNELMLKSGADQPAGDNEGWGISVHRSFVSYVAVATKVKVENDKVSVLEMHSVIDAGRVVNPDRVKSQQEGAMIFGLSIALMGEVTIKEGAVQQSNYHDYTVLRMHQCPKIVTHIIESTAAPGGVGEPGVPPVAASVVNAIYHASSTRIRALPVSKHYSV
ncbi:molybdopterin cofactor-binding domain-containing protein [Paraglaciecola polaris]|uniref:Isoquinoline 1-oxidoreductase, beta subunit n=3 Tax=Paraglaciecola polaris TaxID=222814 RepID=K6YMB8_9ALTE|nr:molybdopterin cofactor-binding domain-containing protein [Paraglaciecola polaris]GAC33819.1 isoquinoline 1-oxidoreductase, beta subunit [Paraglaciecola polaris LMG 21857]|tara:strand:+ start:1863 stop:4118 length:2256 start_codon:yes stop_codon:yes gene_type:complete